MKNRNVILVLLLVAAVVVNLLPFPAFANPSQTDNGSNSNNNDNNSNIRVNLFDYSTGNTETVSPSSNYNAGINKNHNFKFLSDAGNLASNHMNKWTGAHGYPRTGIVETKLVNGYPKLVNGESLAYLFNETQQTGKTSYLNVGGLFQVDDKGYTYFNSDDNYAEYNSDTNSFVLKDIITRNKKPFPCFYPFDARDSVYKKAQGNSGVDTNYNSLTANNANHYFGMTVETEFYTLEDGKIKGEDMVFNFSGDDDVWVFIDDTLVLDIGGIHTAVSGSINFNTGEVFIANDEGKKQAQGNMYTNAKIDRSDYTKHSLKVFYLERGNSASNCNISFNMPTIPKESVAVTKKVVDESGKQVNENLMIDFQFAIKKNGEPLSNADFVLYDGSDNQNRTTDENGYFYLKNGHSAFFPNFAATDTFEVAEIDYALNGYNVILNGREIEIVNKENEVLGIIPTASSGTLAVKDTQNVLFKNIVTKTTDLSITKQISEENYNIVGKEFVVMLELNGKPYVGDYIMDGKTYNTTDGTFILRNEETVTIKDLPYGTSFKVSEPKNEAYTQDYTLSPNIYDTNHQDNQDDTAVYGKIGGTSEVISINKEIPNEENSVDLNVVVEWVNDVQKNRPKEITFDLYKNGEIVISNMKISSENNWQYTFENLHIYDGDIKNVYSVVETKIGNEDVENDIAMGYYTEEFITDEALVIRNTFGGDVIIEKNIDDRIEENPIFIFKITDRFNNVRYEVIKFDTNETTKEIVVRNIALGHCTIEEVDVLRYEAVGNTNVELTIKREIQKVDFNNELVHSPYFTDTDYVKNHFVVGEQLEVIT